MRSASSTVVAIALAISFAAKVRADEPPPKRASPTPLTTIDELKSKAQMGVTFIEVDAFKRRIQANKKLVVLDVRTAKEYDAAHLKGATWVERGVAEFVLVRQLPDPDIEIVVYCKAGYRTGLAIKALREAGYRNVVGLAGGFDAWAAQGNPVHNYLGEFKLVRGAGGNAGTTKLDFFAPKTE